MPLEVELIKVRGGYRLNGFPLIDLLDTPEGRAAVKVAAAALAEDVERRVLAHVLTELDADQ